MEKAVDRLNDSLVAMGLHLSRAAGNGAPMLSLGKVKSTRLSREIHFWVGNLCRSQIPAEKHTLFLQLNSCDVGTCTLMQKAVAALDDKQHFIGVNLTYSHQ